MTNPFRLALRHLKRQWYFRVTVPRNLRRRCRELAKGN